MKVTVDKTEVDGANRIWLDSDMVATNKTALPSVYHPDPALIMSEVHSSTCITDSSIDKQSHSDLNLNAH